MADPEAIGDQGRQVRGVDSRNSIPPKPISTLSVFSVVNPSSARPANGERFTNGAAGFAHTM
jgi:hypothetical protein